MPTSRRTDPYGGRFASDPTGSSVETAYRRVLDKEDKEMVRRNIKPYKKYGFEQSLAELEGMTDQARRDMATHAVLGKHGLLKGGKPKPTKPKPTPKPKPKPTKPKPRQTKPAPYRQPVKPYKPKPKPRTQPPPPKPHLPPKPVQHLPPKPKKPTTRKPVVPPSGRGPRAV